MNTTDCLGIPVPCDDEMSLRMNQLAAQAAEGLISLESLVRAGYGLGYYSGKLDGVDAARARITGLIDGKPAS